MRCRQNPAISLLCMIILWAPLQAQEGAPLFDEHAPLAVTIVAPLQSVSKQRDTADYHDGTVRFTDTDGAIRELDVKLRARGRYRNRTTTCGFPPIRLNFRKKQVEGTRFAGQNKLKLVTHCQNSSERYEQLLLKEFLAYRIWQSITDNSFRVRLLRIDWVDAERDGDSQQRFGFLLEDEERLGKRLGYPLSNIPTVNSTNLVEEQAALLGLFEYMIGNTDFSMLAGPADEVCCHNVVLYETPTGHLPIPYDFDFSGLVNAPYAEPNPRFKLRSVRTRLYRGRCEHNNALGAATRLLQDQKPSIYQLIDELPGMNARTRKSVKSYLDGFYKVIDNPRRVESRLLKRCV